MTVTQIRVTQNTMFQCDNTFMKMMEQGKLQMKIPLIHIGGNIRCVGFSKAGRSLLEARMLPGGFSRFGLVGANDLL